MFECYVPQKLPRFFQQVDLSVDLPKSSNLTGHFSTGCARLFFATLKVMKNIFHHSFNAYKTDIEPRLNDVTLNSMQCSRRLFEIQLSHRRVSAAYIEGDNVAVTVEGEASYVLNFDTGKQADGTPSSRISAKQEVQLRAVTLPSKCCFSHQGAVTGIRAQERQRGTHEDRMNHLSMCLPMGVRLIAALAHPSADAYLVFVFTLTHTLHMLF